MKSNKQYSRLLAAAALAGTLGVGPAWAKTHNYTINPNHFAIAFQINHIDYSDVIGMFLKANGDFEYDEAARTLKSGRVVVAADSVFSNHKARDRHVRDSDSSMRPSIRRSSSRPPRSSPAPRRAGGS